jgi:hypothetical protein
MVFQYRVEEKYRRSVVKPITPLARAHCIIGTETVKISSLVEMAIFNVRSNNIRKSLGRKMSVISRLLSYVSSLEYADFADLFAGHRTCLCLGLSQYSL